MAGRPGRLVSGLGLWSARHWRLVLILWAIVAGWAAWQSSFLERHLKGEIGGISGSVSDRVMATLSREFDFPFAHFLVVTLEAESPGSRVSLPAAKERVTRSLSRLSGVVGVRALPTATPDVQAIAIGLSARSVEDEEAFVVPVRKTVARDLPAGSGIRALTTGHAALNADMVTLGSEQTRNSELLVLPLVLVALLLAFGAIGAALAPLVSGAGAVLLSMGLLDGVAHLMPLSVYASNVATMLGLGLGIDYSLFLVTRVREEAATGAPDALQRAIARTAPIILTAAGTVLVGLAAMGTVPMAESIAMGIGGAVVAVASLLASLTLLPALLVAMGPFLDSPRRISSRLTGAPQIRRWQARASRIVAHPYRWLLLAIALLALLAAPVWRFQFGFPELSLAPRQLDSIRALEAIHRMGIDGALVPVQVLVTAPERPGMLARQRLVGLSSLATWLQRQPQVAEVYAIATPQTLPALVTSATLLGFDHLRDRLPSDAKWLLSRDGTTTLLQVIPRNGLTFREVREFTRTLRHAPWGELQGLKGAQILVGGPSAVEVDFIDTAQAALVPLALLIMAATFALLFAHTGSVVIPLKALASNLLTVTAVIGATVFLFQTPVTARLLGLSGPVPSVPAVFPIMVFCLLFGLSMDYEVMLIGRIHEAHLEGASDRAAVIGGLGTSGGVITNAAVLMAIVFLGFTLTDLVHVKLLGVALALGVILDATVTRLLLIPTLMILLGRWNWWPARPAIAAAPAAQGSLSGSV